MKITYCSPKALLAILIPLTLGCHPPQKKSHSPLTKGTYTQLPNWDQNHHAKSLRTFQKSCQVMLKKRPEQSVGFAEFHMQAKDWFLVCTQALKLGSHLGNQQAKYFFEHYFTPYQWTEKSPGLFTGYYSPEFKGRLEKGTSYRYPIYATPNDLVIATLADFSPGYVQKIIYGKIQGKHLIPYDTRAQISKGSIQSRASVLAWVKNPMDALELEIQGAGVIVTPTKKIILNYAAQNGHPYQAIGKFLIEEHKINRTDISMFKIREYFNQYPNQIDYYFNRNPSYVFFKEVDKPLFFGAQNIPLTPGYSMAIDQSFVPLGMPVFISTELPTHRMFNRLMIAQDIGGAIKGPIRGDIYWGAGAYAREMASLMKQEGNYWLLIPNSKCS